MKAFSYRKNNVHKGPYLHFYRAIMQQKTNPTENVQILPFHSIVRHEVHDLIETTVIVDP